MQISSLESQINIMNHASLEQAGLLKNVILCIIESLRCVVFEKNLFACNPQLPQIQLLQELDIIHTSKDAVRISCGFLSLPTLPCNHTWFGSVRFGSSPQDGCVWEELLSWTSQCKVGFTLWWMWCISLKMLSMVNACVSRGNLGVDTRVCNVATSFSLLPLRAPYLICSTE